MPPHRHNINDPSHTHELNVIKDENVYVELDPVEPIYEPIANDGNMFGTSITEVNNTITIENSGDDIQAIDPVSGLAGANITPPYIAVRYAICFSQNTF